MPAERRVVLERRKKLPELPEVETLRRGMERHLTGRTITQVRVPVPKMLKGASPIPANSPPR